MKILEINKFYYRRRGAEHHFFDLCELLASRGEAVVPFAMKDPRNEPTPFSDYFVDNSEFGKFNWHSFTRPFKVMYSFEAKKNLSRMIAAENPDIAHLHLFYHHLSPSILVALKNAKIPTIMTIHDWQAICPNYSLFTEGKICERCRGGHYWQCARHSCIHRSFPRSLGASIEAYIHHAKKYFENYIDLLIAPSEFVRQMFIRWGWPKDKLIVLPHFLSPSIERMAIAAPMPATPRFAYIGALSKEKGISELVNYWIKQNISPPLDIYGSGPLMEKISKKIRKQSGAKIVLHGQMNREEVYQVMRSTTALIVPSVTWETFGLNIIESFSQGVPVIAANLGGPAELVKNSGAGILFDWGTNGLKNALEEIANPAYRGRAVEYMSTHHLAGDYYADLMKIFSALISAER